LVSFKLVSHKVLGLLVAVSATVMVESGPDTAKGALVGWMEVFAIALGVAVVGFIVATAVRTTRRDRRVRDFVPRTAVGRDPSNLSAELRGGPPPPPAGGRPG